MTKQELRQLIREQKGRHTAEELQTASQAIASTLLNYIQQQQKSNVVLLYHSLPDEVCTHELIHTLAAAGKTVLLPTVVGNDLQLHEYTGNHQLSASATFGIQESEGPIFTDYAKIDLAIVPGMAFTPQGDRLGRGKGYYDRLLPHLHCPLVGLAFSFQIVPNIPCEPHDIRMHTIITETN